MGNALKITSRKYDPADLEDISEKYGIDFVKVKSYYEDYEIFRIKTGGELPKGFIKITSKRMIKLLSKVVGDAKNKDVDLYVHALYRAFDRDDNGTLSFEEFLLGYCMMNSKDERLKLKFAFKMYDLNKDGKLNQTDLISLSHSFSRALNLHQSNSEDEVFVRNLIKELDSDKNGWISENEFIDGLMKNKSYREFLAGFI